MSERRNRALLPIGFGLMVVIIAAIALLSEWTLRTFTERTELVERRLSEKVDTAETMRSIILRRSHLLALVPTMSDVFERDEARLSFNALARDFIVSRERLIDLLDEEDNKEQVRTLRQRNAQTNAHVQRTMDLAVDLDPAVDLTNAMRRAFETLASNRATVDAIIRSARLERARVLKETGATSADVRAAVTGLGVGGVLLGLLIAVVVIAREQGARARLESEVVTRQQAEEELRRSNDSLEERVHERTRQLREEVEERARMQDSLRESEARSRVVLETVFDGIVTLNDDGNIEQANPAIERLSGYGENDLLGQPLSKLIPGVGRGKVASFWDQETDVRHHEGHAVPVLVTAEETVVGDQLLTICTIRDITEIKAAQDAMRAALEDAQQASAVKSEFLANMSHELRSPLNAIIGFTEAMEMGVFGSLNNERYEDYVKSILGSSRHLLALINDILDLSVIESGQMTLHDTIIKPHPLAEESIAMTKAKADQAGLGLVIDDRTGGVTLRADELRVRQMLINLLVNAIKFTPKGGVVTLSAGVGEDDCVWMSVADTGVGMAADDKDRALARFGQVGDRADLSKEGVGLGLPLVNSLMRAHGGDMTLESTHGVGTTVTLRFPKERSVH